MLDIPNERSSHSVPTPRGGGLAAVFSFFLGLIVLWFLGVISYRFILIFLPSGLLVAAVGWLDDHRALSARLRLLVHFVAAGLGLYCMGTLPSVPFFGSEIGPAFWSYVIFLPAVVWAVNLNNFMDGIDGIAAGESISVTLGAALILWMSGGDFAHVCLLILLAVATAGFLFWNWPPAKIFMGDACSGFLGLSIGFFALITSVDGTMNLWSWIILYGVFLVDATYTLGKRIVRGDKFYEAHRSHAYQILSRRLQSHKKVTSGVLVVNICWLFPIAIVTSLYPSYAFLGMIAALTPLLVLAVKTGAGTTNQ